MSSLSGQAIFLSASFPSGARGDALPAARPSAIADAVTSVVRAVFEADGRLVFGGHPTISPLVLLVAREYGRREAVDIYQSLSYQDVIPDETKRLAEGYGTLHWTDDIGEDSLVLMRKTMLAERPSAGVFIGGMQGVVDEFALLPDVPRFLIAAPGGAALWLARHAEDWQSPAGFEDYMESPVYPLVADAIVRAVSSRPG